jgi:hypothetical protein
MSARKRRRGTGRPASAILAGTDASLLDLVDNVLNKGVLVDGELVLGVADVDLIYLRLSAILAAADRVLPAFGKK